MDPNKFQSDTTDFRLEQALAHTASQVFGWYDSKDPFWEKLRIQLNPDASSSGSELSLPVRWRDWFDRRHTRLSDRFSWYRRMNKSAPEKRSQLIRDLTDHISACLSGGGRYILAGDQEYPRQLCHMSKPPYGFSTLGPTKALEWPGIAIIGSRKASCLAIHESFNTGYQCARFGLSVISGGAYGCDITAHQGLLSWRAEAGKSPPAIVVFAGGLSSLYPKGNSRVFNDILSNGGLLISERLWHQPARPRDFPSRNRIICGLVKTVIVMQAGTRSGAMITAREALDQGRDLMVFKQEPSTPGSAGGLSLIEDGADFFTNSLDMISDDPERRSGFGL